jgi:hypothetical protein
MANLRVMGAGTGGLCLVHGLRASGVDVQVFERDRTPTDRPQGYRLTINAHGSYALRTFLPQANFARYIAALAKISTAVSFLDHKLRRLAAVYQAANGRSIGALTARGRSSVSRYGRSCCQLPLDRDRRSIVSQPTQPAAFRPTTPPGNKTAVARRFSSKRATPGYTPDPRISVTNFSPMVGRQRKYSR